MSKKNRRNEPRSKPRANLFGTHAVTEAYRNPARHIDQLFVTESSLRSFQNVIDTCEIKRPSPQILERKAFEKMFPGAVHQGIALDCTPLDEVFIQDIIAKKDDSPNSTLLMLDQVTDPHNVGAIIRSASAFGADGLIMQRKHSPSLEGVLAKTASGATEHIDVTYEINLSDCLDTLRNAGYFSYGLDEKGATDIRDVKQGGKTVIVLGAEGKGLRPKVKEHCDELVRLPTQGSIQSLNVSNAAAVSLFAMCPRK